LFSPRLTTALNQALFTSLITVFYTDLSLPHANQMMDLHMLASVCSSRTHTHTLWDTV